jgi:ABC-type dipeptide/oligopeptide/nickel transport system permease subunit
MAITIAGRGLDLLGDALHDLLDPRLQGPGRRR